MCTTKQGCRGRKGGCGYPGCGCLWKQAKLCKAGLLESCVVEDKRKHWGRASQSGWAFSRVLLQLVSPGSMLLLKPLASFQSCVWGYHHVVPVEPAPQVKLVDTGEEFIPARELQKAPGEAENKLTSLPVVLPLWEQLLRTLVGFATPTTRYFLFEGASCPPCGKDMFLSFLPRDSLGLLLDPRGSVSFHPMQTAFLKMFPIANSLGN